MRDLMDQELDGVTGGVITPSDGSDERTPPNVLCCPPPIDTIHFYLEAFIAL